MTRLDMLIKKVDKTFENAVYLGSAGVDSGQLLITDPCYINDKKVFNYKNMETESSNELINKHGACVGIVMRTQIGDGLFPVFARYAEDGKTLLRFEILIEQEDPE